jgi:hypothetical protein
MKRLLLVAVMVLVSLVGMVGFSRADNAKMYYLTKNSFDGGDAITACDSGFHMASLSEIQDPSNVQYAPGRKPAYDSTYEFVPFDQASDQFPDHIGWVRSGVYPPSGFVNDCGDFRDKYDIQLGTTMTRRSLWGEDNGHSLYEESDPAAWWQSTQTASCSQPEPVWCVEDPDYGAVTEPPATVNAGTEYNWTAYYYPNNGAVTDLPATVNAGDDYSSPYYDSNKGAVTEPPAMVCTGRIDQLEGGCI